MIKNLFQKSLQQRQEFLRHSKWSDAHVLIATWMGSGFLIPAPGTWGTLSGLASGLIILKAFGVAGLVSFIFITTLCGMWAIQKIEKQSPIHDSSLIVIDEVIAINIILLALSFLQLNPIIIAFSFIIFRIFDALKPWPISWLDQNIKGAMGVMVDDIVAAFVTILMIYTGWFFL